MKVDAVPGRLNETYFKANREGIYYGQCSELCGKDHAFMPIDFRVVAEAFRGLATTAEQICKGTAVRPPEAAAHGRRRLAEPPRRIGS